MARVLYWFRTDLRLHDSPALHAALNLKPAALFPVWCWDPNYIYKHRVGLNRFRFLLESMQDVSDGITKINPLSQLLVVRGDPADLLPELFKRWSITHCVFEQDVNGYARERDKKVQDAAKKAGVEVVIEPGHHLWDVEEILKKHGGKPTMSMKALEGAVKGLGDPARPVDAPTKLPSPLLKGKSEPSDRKALLSELRKTLEGLPEYSKKPGPPKVDLNSAQLGGQRKPDGKVTCYDTLTGPDQDAKDGDKDNFTVPTLTSLGMDPAACGAAPEASVPGGETEALRRLEKICKDAAYVATFAKPKTSPSSDTLEPSTTLLSPFLKFGCLSIRKLWWDTQDVIDRYKGSKTSPPENLHGQLLFREMYAVAELAVGDAFQGIRGNKVSRYMDWYLPTHYDKEGNKIEPRPRGDDVSESRLEAFRAGQTGFPWIDALVRQLRLTGWVHHLGRHSLASFLTRGQCWISWERGSEVFEEWLLDWDPNANPGNWMWLSCSAFFAQYFRVYGIATFPAKYDKSGGLVRKYCPELAKFPDKFIYAPHTAPMEVQKKAGCIIGKDYPFPILDEKEEKARCLNRCKAAYDVGFYGTSKEVLEGKAEGILRKMHGEPDPKPPKKDPGTNSKIPDWAKAGHEAKSTTGSSAPPKKEEEDEREIEPHETDDHGDEAEQEEKGADGDEETVKEQKNGGTGKSSSKRKASKSEREGETASKSRKN